MRGKGGQNYSLSNFNILQINSPGKRLKGPYSVVYQDMEQ